MESAYDSETNVLDNDCEAISVEDEDLIRGLESENDDLPDDENNNQFSNIYARVIQDDKDAIRSLCETAKCYQQMYCANGKNYTKDELVTLMKAYRGADGVAKKQAGEKLVMSVARFVVRIAMQKYPTYFPKHGLDLIQEGLTGVVLSLQNYNPDKGYLTTWSSRAILHNMQQYVSGIAHNTTPHYGTNIREIQSFTNRKEQQGLKKDVDWYDTDIYINTGISLVTIQECEKIIKRNKNASSINNEEDYIGETVAGTMQTPEEAATEKYTQDKIEWAINELLTKQEQQVIRLSYGYEPCGVCSDAEISRRTEIPLQDIRKIKNLGQEKLRRFMCRDASFNEERTSRSKHIMKRGLQTIETMRSRESLERETLLLDYDNAY